MKLYFDKINKIRKDRGLSITGLSKLTGITRATLWNWEHTEQIPGEHNVRNLAKALNVRVDEISDLKDIDVSQDQVFPGAVNSWKLLTQMDNKKQADKFNNILREMYDLNDNVSQAKVIINALTSSMDIIFYIKDIESNYLIASDSFIKNLKLNPGYNVIGKNDNDFFSAKEAKTNYLEDKEVFETKRPTYREGIIPGSRKKKWGLIKKAPVFDAEGKVVGIIGIFIDITDKKAAEEKRDLFMHLMDNFPFVISFGPASKDIVEGTKTLYANKVIEEITGMTLDEIYSKGTEYVSSKVVYNDLGFSHMKELVRKADAEKRFDRDSFYSIIQLLSKNKISWSKGINKYEIYKGKKYAIAIHVDITEEKEKDLEIDIYKQIINDLNKDNLEIIWMVKSFDDGGLYLFYANDSFEKITGYKKSEFIDQTPVDEIQLGLPLDYKPYHGKKQIYSIIDPNDEMRIKEAVKQSSYPKEFQFKIKTTDDREVLLKTSVNMKKIKGLSTVFYGKAKVV